jgi:hypothetical protein
MRDPLTGMSNHPAASKPVVLFSASSRTAMQLHLELHLGDVLVCTGDTQKLRDHQLKPHGFKSQTLGRSWRRPGPGGREVVERIRATRSGKGEHRSSSVTTTRPLRVLPLRPRSLSSAAEAGATPSRPDRRARRARAARRGAVLEQLL